MIINKKLLSLWLALALIAVLALTLCGQFRAQEMLPYSIYFGNLHSHTSYSDGTSTPAQAYQYAKNSGLGDFLALSDHAHLLDAAEWADTKTQADKFTDVNFTSVAGFEFTTASGDLGIYHTEWFTEGSRVITPTAYYDYLVANRPDSITQWNHPLSSDGGISDYGDYSAGRDTVVELMEIVNRTKRYEASYSSALDAGWHIAPTAGQDNHDADWLTGLETRTAIMAASLTRNDLYDALKAHRVYATENRNLKISYEINGSIMGTTISTETCNVSIHVEDPDTNIDGDRISRVELVRNGGSVAAVQVPDAYSTDWTPTIEPCNAPYYFVRVTNAADEKAWTAPIWITAAGQYILTVRVVGDGEVSPSADAHAYPTGTNVSLTAIAHPGSTFSGWSGDVSGSANPATVTMTRNKTVTASFLRKWKPISGVDFIFSPTSATH